jgi:replication factor C subunit 2/4
MVDNWNIDLDSIFDNHEHITKKKNHITRDVKTKRFNNQTTWVDKYRPKKINEIIGHNHVKNMLLSCIKTGNLPHLLFHGSSGTGKTSTVFALINQLYGPRRVNEKVLELNASDENGINVVRGKIIKFANIVVGTSDPDYPSPPYKIIILDEADSMTSEAQTALKKVMEKTCDITRFVFICNYENKIIDAIKSRCASFRFNKIDKNLLINKLKIIAKKEDIKINDDIYDVITEICDGDARRSINTLQNIKYILKTGGSTVKKTDIYNITSYVDKKYLDKYWNTILKGSIDLITDVVLDITNDGYPTLYILNCIKDKVIDTKMTDIKKARILIHVGQVERMVNTGSNNYIQLMAVFAYINGIYNNINIDTPLIY